MKTKILILLSLLVFNLNAQNNNNFIKSDKSIEIKFYPEFEFNSDSLFIDSEHNLNFQNLVENNEFQKAINLLNKTELIIPNNYLVEATKATLYLQINEIHKSYNIFNNCVNLVKDNTKKSSFYYILSALDMVKEEPENAYENLIKSFELDNTNFNKAMILGEFSLQLNSIENAILYFEKAIRINDQLNNVKNKLGFIYQNNQNYSKSIKLFSEIISTEPESAFAYNNRAYSYLKINLYNKALSDVNKSISLLPTNSYAFRNRALIYIAMKNYNDSCKDIKTAIELDYVENFGSDIIDLKNEFCKE